MTTSRIGWVVLWVGLLLGAGLLPTVSFSGQSEEEPVGKRPYEMDWANRYEDTRAPLVDFEDLAGWTVECRDAEASWERSRREQLWGKYVGRLSYRGKGPRPVVVIRPPEPIRFAGPVDCVNVWVYGNNWAWMPDPSTPQVRLAVLLRTPEGKPLRAELGAVYWKEWFLVHTKLTAEQARQLDNGGVVEGIEVAGGTNPEDRVIYFDNLALYREELPPLEFAPRPRRPITLPEGQTVGTNTGPGVLPFPTREETILPDQLTPSFRTELVAGDGEFRFCYQGEDGTLVYIYRPAEGHWGDWTVEWNGRLRFRPMVGGGVRLRQPDGNVVDPSYELRSCRMQDEAVVSVWTIRAGEVSGEVAYTFRLWQKSLVIDVICRGGIVGEVTFGRAEGLPQPRLVTLPYLTCDHQRPAVVVAGPADAPIFMLGLVDYYRSNASALFAVNELGDAQVRFNGGSRYLAKTDGTLNDCFERIFLTISPRFEEVLPNIPNPKSPWMHVTGERVWRAHGASDRNRDYELWKRIARLGMRKIVVTDHETGWRDGGESFTLRTRAAPGKGGDEGQRWYSQKMHELGFLYGIYNNYTDYAPVNEFWDEDCVTRTPDGNWRRAWPRCYNLKPARAVEFEAKLAPIIQEKFHLTTAYCDVHTAVRPWDYVDYDARVPGAGTFAATFYAYGEIMLSQKATWNGPVYSEGNNHWYYCGLTDGNYAQDQLARLDINPWLVDFDLRKLHPLCCNFGMGNLEMFYPAGRGELSQQAALDRFLAATLAFGHTGFLVLEGGLANAVRSYYGVQQVHARYSQAVVEEILYHDGSGGMLPTGKALSSGAYKRSQLYVRYNNGLQLWVNGHTQDNWQPNGLPVTLPPNGWYAKGKFSDGELLAFSALWDGERVDYVDSPEYLYANGRGKLTRLPKVICDGQIVLLPERNGTFELIPLSCTTMAVDLGGRSAQAIALGEDPATELGAATVRLSRNFVFIEPKDGAFSYRLIPAEPSGEPLSSPREKAVPGERVPIHGQGIAEWIIPRDAKPGSLVWLTVGNRHLHFLVVPLVDTELVVNKDDFRLRLRSHLGRPATFRVSLQEQELDCQLSPETWSQFDIPLKPPTVEGLHSLALEVKSDGFVHRESWILSASRQAIEISPFPAIQAKRQILRGKEEPIDVASGAFVTEEQVRCGGVEKAALYMHPPYRKGVGCVAAITEPVRLPAELPAVLRCLVGKGDGSDPGDGILYRVFVLDSAGHQELLGEKHQKEHAWSSWELDLSRWQGKEIRFKLVADVGPAGNSVGDWACWADLKIQSASPQWVYTLKREKSQ
ncbi:MAG: hypothetical protein RMJ16_14005 [Thermoguttaceae bacterium]|nr:hypothetical protein [Thermoguttaceae bacterium]